jgi:hypothetical protein
MSEQIWLRTTYSREPFPDALIADKGCDSDALVENLEARGIAPIIPPKANRKHQRTTDFALHRERILVDRLHLETFPCRRNALRQARQHVSGRSSTGVRAHVVQLTTDPRGAGGGFNVVIAEEKERTRIRKPAVFNLGGFAGSSKWRLRGLDYRFGSVFRKLQLWHYLSRGCRRHGPDRLRPFRPAGSR